MFLVSPEYILLLIICNNYAKNIGCCHNRKLVARATQATRATLATQATQAPMFCLPLGLKFTQLLRKIKIYRNIILPVVLYGCGTWSLALS